MNPPDPHLCCQCSSVTMPIPLDSRASFWLTSLFCVFYVPKWCGSLPVTLSVTDPLDRLYVSSQCVQWLFYETCVFLYLDQDSFASDRTTNFSFDHHFHFWTAFQSFWSKLQSVVCFEEDFHVVLLICTFRTITHRFVITSCPIRQIRPKLLYFWGLFWTQT